MLFGFILVTDVRNGMLLLHGNVVCLTCQNQQGCTNPRCQVAQAAEFCVLELNTYGSRVCNSLCATHLASRNLMLPTDFGKFVDLCVTISVLVDIIQCSYPCIHHELHTIL